MAVMTSQQRAAVHASLMQDMSTARDPCATLKADLRAAIDAADQWAVDNASSYNTALPTAARNTLTAAQKARVLAAVILARFATGA